MIVERKEHEDSYQKIRVLLIVLEKKMATHFSSLAERIPWTEELAGLQSMG